MGAISCPLREAIGLEASFIWSIHVQRDSRCRFFSNWSSKSARRKNKESPIIQEFVSEVCLSKKELPFRGSVAPKVLI
jgi:hypothetical protein